MDIKTIADGNKTTLSLEGWIDTETAPQLEEALCGLPEGTEELELDLAGVEYISSAGIRQLVAAHKQMHGNLSLSNVSNEVLEILNLTGVAKRVAII